MITPVLVACAVALASAQGLPAGMHQAGGGGGDVETNYAEELDEETFEERRLENELVSFFTPPHMPHSFADAHDNSA